ncbi:MAG: ammonia-forming cytochrome c nitrite reductase subunit c552 [Gammaproteobacteria bacterium]|nr:ammonia-forming cytochrome c nitrite reductase subunit c552 [Gammaproteobacteria bacterium]
MYIFFVTNKLTFLLLLLLFTTAVFPDDIEHNLNHSLNHGYVGQKVCAQCHAKEAIQWSGSHHDLAMQEATSDTVLGNFNDFDFTYNQITSTFFIKENKFWVTTDGPDGTLQDFMIQYTFGAYPLQQYLIAMPGGRLQVLDIAWDSRPAELGGQRWYHLHPDDNIDFKDVLHWTGPNLNWNYMCADCHSTNLQKNYDAASASYKTQWSELDVSCEACHGPGQAHQQWALSIKEATGNSASESSAQENKGLSVVLNERKGVRWNINSGDGKPYRSVVRLSKTEIEICARCHSRRSQFAQPRPGDPSDQAFMDNFRPALLTQGLYHADGQIQDEVYVYGSFLQSKMHQAGVSCSDCHDPHLAGLRLPGDRVCNQCHLPRQYRTQQHHFHPASANTTCLDCHMPVQTYMGVDQRHDHSFRIPRPDLSEVYKTPNACQQCHTDKTAQWSAQQLTLWNSQKGYGKKESGLQQYAPVLAAQRRQLANADKQAINLLLDNTQPVIARATALSQLASIEDRATVELIEQQLQHDDAMLRLAALEVLDTLYALGSLDFSQSAQLAYPLLSDKVRSVRMAAARIVAPADQQQLAPEAQEQLQKALQEYIDGQLFNAERPGSHVNLGNLYHSMNDDPRAEQAYRQALKLQPQFVPAWINLAQFYSDLQRDKDALQTLQQGLQQVSKSAELHHATGLAQVRLKLLSEAIVSLQKAAQLAPENSRYSYVYAIALNSYQRPGEALDVLQQAHEQHPQNREILSALVSINHDNAHSDKSLHYAEKILQLEPDNTAIQGFIMQLKKHKK